MDFFVNNTVKTIKQFKWQIKQPLVSVRDVHHQRFLSHSKLFFSPFKNICSLVFPSLLRPQSRIKPARVWLGNDASAGRKESKWGEYKGKYGFIGIGVRSAVISAHVVVIKCNVLHCSGGASFSFTCNIHHAHCRSAYNTLARKTNTSTHTYAAFRVKRRG